MATIDLNRVATFVRVVERGSFTSAAREMKVPTSSVSRSISRLEADLGVRLMQRTTRKLHLTDAGHEYFTRVRGAVTDLGDATAEAGDHSTEIRGLIRISVPPSPDATLAEIVAAFVRKHPRVRIEVSVSSRFVNLVDEGFDLALRAGRLDDSTLVRRKIGETDLGLFAAPSYLRRRGRPRVLDDLADHECVVYRTQSGRASWVLSGPGGTRELTVVGAVVCDDMSFMREAAAAGAGIALLPAYANLGAVAEKELVRVLPEYALRGTPLNVVMPSSRFIPARVALFRDFLVDRWRAALSQAGMVERIAAAGTS